MGRSIAGVVACAVLLIAFGCAEDGRDGLRLTASDYGVVLPAEPQVAGDPEVGRRVLLDGDFMTCGFPARLWDYRLFRETLARVAGGSTQTLPGRSGRNAELPYYLNAFTTRDGAEVINYNCLLCHGGTFDGEVVIGLPNNLADFTADLSAGQGVTDLAIRAAAELLGLSDAERDNLDKMLGRQVQLAPLTRMRTVGNNPAEALAIGLMVQHDRDTLAWTDAPVTDITLRDHDGRVLPLDEAVLTSDPAPWWRVHEKHALFSNGMARGDHRGTMMLATSACVDNLEDAARVDELFVDLQAFVESVRAPRYLRAIDRSLAASGSDVYRRDCAGCHGAHGAGGEAEGYPNRLIRLDDIGTDPVVAEGGTVHAPQLVEWYNGSFYGRITPMVPDDPFPGYMPPPLAGIWATGPFLHNGSVPTLEGVLDSSRRPTFWRRVDLDNGNFDEEALGFPFEELDHGWHAASADERKLVYDTTLWSQSNGGHRYGDHLSSHERRAVLEYLKTF